MKKLLIAIFLIITVITLLNINVTYRRGIDYQVQSIKIPLYLKVLDFFDRHYNYKNLVKEIIGGSINEHEQVDLIFKWVHYNIRRPPEGFPIVDDHVWYIIVRGYGTSDQSNDVFTTLCNYAGIDAFFDFIYPLDKRSVLPLSFVKLNNSWSIFDSYNGVYFRNKEGNVANLDDIRKGDWSVFNAAGITKQNSDYVSYLENIPPLSHIGLKRANIQSPLRRLIFQLKRWGVFR